MKLKYCSQHTYRSDTNTDLVLMFSIFCIDLPTSTDQTCCFSHNLFKIYQLQLSLIQLSSVKHTVSVRKNKENVHILAAIVLASHREQWTFILKPNNRNKVYCSGKRKTFVKRAQLVSLILKLLCPDGVWLSD